MIRGYLLFAPPYDFFSLRHPDDYLNHLVGKGILLISIPSSFRKVTLRNRAERDQEQIISIPLPSGCLSLNAGVHKKSRRAAREPEARVEKPEARGELWSEPVGAGDAGKPGPKSQ